MKRDACLHDDRVCANVCVNDSETYHRKVFVDIVDQSMIDIISYSRSKIRFVRF